jgi:hypothetical protein
MVPLREVIMTVQSDNKGHGLIDKSWAQMVLLTAVVIVLIVLSAHYLW